MTPLMISLDLFEEDETKISIEENYVSNNSLYAKEYISVVNKYIKEEKGYVTLSRIMYFKLENNNLTYDEIYFDNLDLEKKQELPISKVCDMKKYKNYRVCVKESIKDSGQNDFYTTKPFSKPIDFNVASVSSFFMQNRNIGASNIHKGWDLSASAGTPVYSICDGVVEYVTFPYGSNNKNMLDKSGDNRIKLKCFYNNETYDVYYMHLYPYSYKVKQNDKVYKGQTIAGVGTTGMSTGNHLHFQINLNGKEIDGMKLINFN